MAPRNFIDRAAAVLELFERRPKSIASDAGSEVVHPDIQAALPEIGCLPLSRDLIAVFLCVRPPCHRMTTAAQRCERQQQSGTPAAL
jgi:hypothetical protein